MAFLEQALVLCQFPVGVPISRPLLEYNVKAAEPKTDNPNASSHRYRYLVFNTRSFPILGLRSRRASNLRVRSEGKTLVGCLLGPFTVYLIYWLCCVGWCRASLERFSRHLMQWVQWVPTLRPWIPLRNFNTFCSHSRDTGYSFLIRHQNLQTATCCLMNLRVISKLPISHSHLPPPIR